jgi:membrane protease YdiL (CAAX protease family)
VITAAPAPELSLRRVLATAGIILALAAFCALFLLADNGYYRFTSVRFPSIGASTALANLWGVLSRAHLLIVLIPLILLRPRLLGFQIGKVRQHWRMLLLMLVFNCGVIGGYLVLTNSSTPYSGNQWLVTEVLTVPFVEETFWRGLVFAVLLFAFRRLHGERASLHLAVWSSGLAFGVLHAGNALAGMPLAFVALQALSACIWGVMYGYARARTDSVYPSMVMHSAMNLLVVLL